MGRREYIIFTEKVIIKFSCEHISLLVCVKSEPNLDVKMKLKGLESL